MISKSKHNRSPIDHLLYVARSIFRSPLIFRWQALVMTYKVSSGTLNLCSLTHASLGQWSVPCLAYIITSAMLQSSGDRSWQHHSMAPRAAKPRSRSLVQSKFSDGYYDERVFCPCRHKINDCFCRLQFLCLWFGLSYEHVMEL